MQAKLKFAVAVLVGAALGVTATSIVHAQQAAAKGKGYIISEITVTDPAAFAKYVAAVPPTLAPFGGQYLTRGNAQIVGLEGTAPQRFIAIQFDSFDKAKAWQESEGYAQAKALRLPAQDAATSRVFLVEGIPPTP